MNNSFQPLPARRKGVRPAWLLCALVAIGLSPLAEAHDVLRAYVQHAIHLAIDAHHVDLTLDLTFFEEWSTRERRIMDADATGNISQAELESYVRKLAPQLAKPLKLSVAGRDLPLVPLYDPEVDLLANHKVGEAHHRLRLFFFAPTPMLHEGDEIVIEDHLWPEAKALATSQAEGRDGCTLTPEASVDARLAIARADGARWFKFRCLKPPLKPSAAQKPPLSGSPASSPRFIALGKSPANQLPGLSYECIPFARPNRKMGCRNSPALRLRSTGALRRPRAAMAARRRGFRGPRRAQSLESFWSRATR